MKFREKLFEASKEIWQEYLSHPFIQGIINGDLSSEKFKMYLIQDYIYLKEYSKVFCMGIVKSDDMAEMRFLYKSISGAMQEGASHIEEMKNLGISEEYAESFEMFKENKDYTGYMLDVALNGDVKQIAIATLPCTWSYNFIGTYVNKNRTKRNQLFDSWVNLYSSEEFNEFTKEWLDYIDKLCCDLTETQEKKLIDIFVKCSKHELEFWNMAWNYAGEKIRC